MNRKTFSILAIFAVVLGLIAILGQQRSGTDSIAGASAGQPLLPELAAQFDAINRIGIIGAGDEPLATLERDASDWVVIEQDRYPADLASVNGLLIALAEARIVEEKTANPDFYARLGVEPVELADAAGVEVVLATTTGTTFAVVLGDAYTGDQRYARISDSAQSVLIDRSPDVALSAADWVSPAIIDIAGSRVRRVEITHADGERVGISKTEQGQTDFSVADIPDGRELQYAGIANVSGTVLQGLELEAVAAASAIDGEPVADIVFETFDGLVVTVDVVADSDGNSWLGFVATADAATDADAAADAEAAQINARLAGWRFRIPSFKYSQLTRRMDDLLAAPADDE